MRIFKKEFSSELTVGMLNGECIITKAFNNLDNNFKVHVQVNDNNFDYLGAFKKLEDAVKFVSLFETLDSKYEYYCQYQSSEKNEGYTSPQMATMGELGWELCTIDSKNIKGDRAMHIYKRRIQPYITDSTYNKNYTNYTIGPVVSVLGESNCKDGHVIEYVFGKNGQGITTELILLGEIISKLSENNRIYLLKSNCDAADDIYYMTFQIVPIDGYISPEIGIGTVEPIYEGDDSDVTAFARGAIKKYGITKEVINYIQTLKENQI